MSDPAAPESEPDSGEVTYRIRRKGGRFQSIAAMWRSKKWLRRITYLAAFVFAALGIFWVLLVKDLPSTDKLADYQPPLPTMVRGIDGDIVHSYARERRVQLRFVDFPKPLIDAYLAAEDKTFWTHGGIDYPGLFGAVIDYTAKIGSGDRARGGSTITQQVAKNILIGNEYSVTRKLKEMVLARRIESVLSKQQILELYLNEIPLGRQSFGVQAASRAYFDKDVDQLDLREVSFLAILPKAPEQYGRQKFEAKALARRNYVLNQMVANGWATEAQAAQARVLPLGLQPRRVERYDPANGYFVEETRRWLIEKFGETSEDGPQSVYGGGLWVRTSLDAKMQDSVRSALRTGMLRYHGNRGWVGPIAHLKDMDSWQTQLIVSNLTIDYNDWRIGVVISRKSGAGQIGFTDGTIAELINIPEKAKVGDILAAAPVHSGTYAVRSIPEVSGGMVIQQPGTGRVVAMQGGFDAGLGSFNRATQAMRQPGSTIKPFVYATGLMNGMTPASQISDGTFCVYQGASLGNKCFRNFGGGGGGTHTMRWGLEQSRNLMTVRIASEAGMPRVIKTFKNVGIGEYKPFLSLALGAGETTVARMVNAYAALANNGVQFAPSLVDYVQDRNGKVIWRSDDRRCVGCNMPEWDGRSMPRIARRGKQVMDAATAYQTVHMLRGVVTRGTAVTLRDLNLPLFGKTGTTSGPTDVWFCGGSQDYVAGVYLGYDTPRSLGGYAQGGRIAAPIFKQVVQATSDRWSRQPFVAPAGIRMVRIDRSSGKQVMGAEPSDDPKASIIWEAFKPDTEPKRYTAQDEFTRKRDALVAEIRAAQTDRAAAAKAATSAVPADFVQEQGGLY